MEDQNRHSTNNLEDMPAQVKVIKPGPQATSQGMSSNIYIFPSIFEDELLNILFCRAVLAHCRLVFD